MNATSKLSFRQLNLGQFPGGLDRKVDVEIPRLLSKKHNTGEIIGFLAFYTD
jgi:hypothetical protein